jgi:hypothetical protein
MTERYKVRVPSDELYRKVLILLEQRVPVFVASEKRRMLSTGEIPNSILDRIRELGATVTPEFQYDPDARNLFTGKAGI